MGWNLKDYEEVKDRLPRFWKDHPEGSVETELVAHAEGDYIVKATLRTSEGRVIATGLAQEHVTSKGVNQTSALENCETSAIGRALANAVWASGPNRPSREEMSKVARAEAPSAAPGRGSSPQTPGRPATDKQKKMINLLVEQTGVVPETWPLADDLSMREASALIDRLQAEDRMPGADERRTPAA